MLEGSSAPESRWVRAARWLQEHAGEGWTLLGIILVPVAEFLQGTLKWAWMVLIGALASLVVGFVIGVRRKGSVNALRGALAAAEVSGANADKALGESERKLDSALSVEVVALFRRFELTPNERVTVYAFDQETGYFFRLNRYSVNPDLGKSGRDAYPEGEGVISRAWQTGASYEPGLPDPNGEPEAYRAWHAAWSITDEVFDDLTMRPRAYIGRALKNLAQTDNVGVIMVESLEPLGLDQMWQNMTDTDLLSLGVHIMLSKPLEAGIGLARKEGF